MLKIILKFMKNVVMGAVLLYAYNKVAVGMNAIIPINLLTILMVAMFKMPAMIGLVLFYFIVF